MLIMLVNKLLHPFTLYLIQEGLLCQLDVEHVDHQPSTDEAPPLSKLHQSGKIAVNCIKTIEAISQYF